MSLLPNLTATRVVFGETPSYLFPTNQQFNSLVNSLSTVNVSTATSAGISVSEPTPNNFVFSNALSNAGGIAFVSVPGSSTLGLSNAGVTGLVAGSGIGLSGATGNVTVSNSGVTSVVAGSGIGVSGGTGTVTMSNTGVLSVSAGTNVSLGGTASAPIINATTVLTPNYILDSWTQSGLSVSTAPGAPVTLVSTMSGLTPGKSYLVSAQGGLSATVNDSNKTMSLSLQIDGIGEYIDLSTQPCNTTGIWNANAVVTRMPVGATALNLVIGGFNTVAPDVVTVLLEDLSITQLN